MKSIHPFNSKTSLMLFVCLLGGLLTMASSPSTPLVAAPGPAAQTLQSADFQRTSVPPPDLVEGGVKQQDGNGRLVLGGTYTLAEGETLQGDLVIAGGSVTLETGSQVQGDILMMGGSLRADGLVSGEILALGGQVSLGENAIVEGSVNMLGGRLDRAAGSQVLGEQGFTLPSPVLPGLPENFSLPQLNAGISPLWKVFWILMRSFLWAAAALLVTLFLPRATRKVGQAISQQPVVAGGLGCLITMVAPVILFLIGITIIGIPISLLAALVLVVAWFYGLIAVGLEVGTRLCGAFKQEWAMPVSAAVGVFLLTIVINSFDALIPCVGWIFPVLVGVVGLGAVLLTRFGTRSEDLSGEPIAYEPGDLQLPPDQ